VCHVARGRFQARGAAESVAAVIAEPVLGEGGFIAPRRSITPSSGNLSQTRHPFHRGRSAVRFGRTGKFFAIEHYGVEPDIITSANPGRGLPLAAVTGRAEVMDAPEVGGLGGTFGGNLLPVPRRSPRLKSSKKKTYSRGPRQLGGKFEERGKCG